jgi:hypothetical protein
MKIVHRVGFSRLDNVTPELGQIGIEYKTVELPGGAAVIYFDVAESHPHWKTIRELIRQ